MRKKQVLEEMSIVEAIDNLTNMTDLDIETVKKYKIAASKGKGVVFYSKWLDIQNDMQTIENIKQTFRVVYEYLKDMGKKDKEKLKSEDTQKGIRSMMILAEEAATKVDRYIDLLEKEVVDRSVKEFKEYQDLNEFYHKKLLKKLQKSHKDKELWVDSLEEETLLGTEIQERGLKDLETVKSDCQYELFYIKKEDGKRFFNRNLLRHIKLVHDFDKVVISQYYEDPFLMAQKVRDRGAHESAKEIKDKMYSHLEGFLKAHSHINSSEFYVKLNQAIYALMLATSGHNLIEAGAKKSCFDYFQDFCLFLQDSFLSTDYHAYSGVVFEEMNDFVKEMMIFVSQLSLCLFMQVGSKDQMIGLINILMDKVGKGEKGKKIPARQMWTALLEGNQHLQNVLKKYPNGPLFKLLDHFHLEEENSFEPLMQQNLPRLLYHIHNESFKIDVLRIPSPTKQEMINKAEGSILFEGFVRALGMIKKNQKLFFINLQDRTSWQDHARCQVIENMPKQAHFVENVEVCTLAKDTSFYKQSEEYLSMNNAKDFKKLLKEQLMSAEECGFYFSNNLSPKYLETFIEKSIDLIHLHFFGEKATLPHKNRLDFIEIFYHCFILKMIDVIRPTELTLSCKDAVDTGPAAYAGFFGFLKLFSQDDIWSHEEEDFFVWMLESSALLHRERAIHEERYERTINALSLVHAELEVNKAKIIKDFENLYGYSIFKHIAVREAKL